MTQEEILKSRPWLQAAVQHTHRNLEPECPYCGTKIGEIHNKTCEIARTGTGEKQKNQKTKPTEIWLGILYPHAHKICVRDNLFCRDIVLRNGEYVSGPYTFEESRTPGTVKFHQPCNATDKGAHFNLNLGLDRAFQENAFKIPL